MHRFPFRFACLILLGLCSGLVQSATDVPGALEPWRGWALKGQEFRACPLIAGRTGSGGQNDFVCAWPGTLDLVADATGAQLSQHWRVDVDAWVALPGDAAHWPQQVSVDGKPGIVVDRDGPALWLEAGSHEVRARLTWRTRPQSLRVPASVGLVALTVDGQRIAPVQRDGDELNLGRDSAAAPEADSLELRVFRRLDDGVPAQLTTVIQLRAAGQPREVSLGPALPAGFAPIALDSQWPARLEADGRLRVRVMPGSDSVRLEARATTPLDAVTARIGAAPWPQQEIWSYAADPRLRMSVASSALAVDPRQTDVPEAWRDLPAFALGDGAQLTIEERSRGAADDTDNRYTLNREMWLDFDANGWFAHDRVHGRMRNGWRLDAIAPFRLERARASGAQSDALLVTQGSNPSLSGVEWRTPQVDLDAGLRVTGALTKLPISGWQGGFDRVDTVLHLPDGYRLLGAPGADRAVGSWMSAWTLLDIFLAAVLILLAWRALGLWGCLAMTAYLLLGYQERGAPLWSLLAVTVLALLVRALPTGRLAAGIEWLRRGAGLLLVLIALPFIATQLRYALYPQLESLADPGIDAAQVDEQREVAAGAIAEMPAEAPAPASPPAPLPQAERSRAKASPGKTLSSIIVTGSRIEPRDIASITEPSLAQTGAGEANWQRGHRYQLSWSGPILTTQTVQLVIAPPWLVRPLRIVLVALLALLMLLILRPLHPLLRQALRQGRSAIGVLLLGAALLGAPAPGQAADFPPDTLLNALRARLLEAPRCAPACATVANVDLQARGNELRIALNAHAATQVALPLPFDDSALSLRSLRVDGVAQDALARQDDALWIGLSRGVHRIEMTLDISGGKVALRFPLPPMRAQFDSSDWEATGLADARLQTETLTLSRLRSDSGASSTMPDQAQRFAPFVRVHRTLLLGAQWRVQTTVERIAPREGGFAVGVPLLAGEHVSSADTPVKDGMVSAALADGEDTHSWTSSLDQAPELRLTAPALDAHAEVWSVVAGLQWHVDYTGVPVVAPADATAQQPQTFEFHPLPGETLTLSITRPVAVAGATRAIDSVRVDHALGQRASTTTLTLALRASQGGEQTITLPADAEVLEVKRDNDTLNLHARNGQLSLPVQPGTQRFELRFRDNRPLASHATTPAIALGLPAANIDLDMSLPADRWLLATRGPLSGPAVLYWGELAVMLLVALALSRLPQSPLKAWQWMLLGVGFSTYSWLALLLVVGWLFALHWRARMAPPQAASTFNLLQIGLAVLTLFALLTVFDSIRHGLLGTPDMHIAGQGSSATRLAWFADRSNDALPVAHAISLPLWSYQLAMLAWSLWLASSLVRWLRDGFAAWTRDGYWRSLAKATVELPDAQPPEPPAA